MAGPEELHRESDLDDAVRQVAHRKARAAQARLGKIPAGREDPREVYLSACDAIAADFEKDGFRYARSGPHATRKESPWIHSIGFQSSHNNVAGEYVSLSLHAGVRAKPFEEWRRRQKHALRTNDVVGGGQIGNLRKNHSWMEWNLGDSATRTERIQDAVAMLRTLAIPFFGLFDDPDRLARELELADLPGVDPGIAAEVLLWQERRTSAERMIRRYLAERPDIDRMRQEAIARFKAEGFPKFCVTAYAEELAILHLVHDLP